MNLIKIKKSASEEELNNALDKAFAQALISGHQALAIQLVDDEEDEVCEKACKALKESTYGYGTVIEALNDGRMAWREAWGNNGDNFIFHQVPAEIPLTTVPNMQSLPDAVKEKLVNRFHVGFNDAHKTIRYNNQLVMVHPDNKIYGWTPSVADLNATDWVIG